MPDAHYDPGVIRPPRRDVAIFLSAGGLALAFFSAAIWFGAIGSARVQWGEEWSLVSFFIGLGLFAVRVVWGVAAGICRRQPVPGSILLLTVLASVVVLWLFVWWALESASDRLNNIGLVVAVVWICLIFYALSLLLVWAVRKICGA